jgi:hypothetical protein
MVPGVLRSRQLATTTSQWNIKWNLTVTHTTIPTIPISWILTMDAVVDITLTLTVVVVLLLQLWAI